MTEHRDGTGPKDQGRRRPRLADVAARVGVSSASASLVLRGAAGPSRQTRERVLNAAAELGYRTDRTASLLARYRTHMIGVMMDVRSTFHAELVQYLHTAAEGVGYDLALSTLTENRGEKQVVESLLDFRCEGLILLGPESSDEELTELGQQYPVVALGRRTASDTVDVVRSDDGRGTGQIVEHLVGLGHREIVLIDGGDSTIADDRRRSYRSAMEHHGQSDRVRVIPGSMTEEAGTHAARTLLQEDRLPTAVIAANDRCALGVLDVFARRGVEVPGTVSVAGYDDSPLSRLAHVDLTTVRQNPEEQAEHAVAQIVERLDSDRVEKRAVVLPPQLVVRGTTAAPRTD